MQEFGMKLEGVILSEERSDESKDPYSCHEARP
jgi:hypothetical protein